MGLGLGAYVDRPDTALGGVTYLVVPRARAARRDRDAVGRVRGDVPDHRRARLERTFHAMYATPISPRDIALGNLAWIAARLTLICDDLHARHRRCSGRPSRRSIVLAIPAAVLTGMAFAAPIAAFAATQKTPNRFNDDLPVRDHAAVPVLRHVLPDRARCRPPLQPLAWLTPLCHGVGADPGAVARDDRATTRSLMLVHVVVLSRRSRSSAAG